MSILKLYHLDFLNKLPSDVDVIKPITDFSKLGGVRGKFCENNFPKGISYFGYENIKPFCSKTSYLTPSAKTKEIFLEYIRQMKYPERLSRFQCIFAVKTHKEVKTWFHTLEKCYEGKKDKSNQVYVYVLDVNDNSYFEADSFFRDAFDSPCEESFNIACEYVKGCNYWSGTKMQDISMRALEILVPLPVNVVGKIKYEDFCNEYS